MGAHDTPKAAALAAFIARKAEIDRMLEQLLAHSHEHLNLAPGEVHWGHVGELDDWLACLRRVAKLAGVIRQDAQTDRFARRHPVGKLLVPANSAQRCGTLPANSVAALGSWWRRRYGVSARRSHHAAVSMVADHVVISIMKMAVVVHILTKDHGLVHGFQNGREKVWIVGRVKGMYATRIHRRRQERIKNRTLGVSRKRQPFQLPCQDQLVCASPHHQPTWSSHVQRNRRVRSQPKRVCVSGGRFDVGQLQHH
jgi:hypothetical protein